LPCIFDSLASARLAAGASEARKAIFRKGMTGLC
jgi:hypothetical protein